MISEDLTDDQIMEIVRYSTVGSDAIPASEWIAFARALLLSGLVPSKRDQSTDPFNRYMSGTQVMEALEAEAIKRKEKYGTSLLTARDIDPEVFDIAEKYINDYRGYLKGRKK